MADLGTQKSAVSRDWENREYTEIIAMNMRKLVDFLNKFHSSVYYKLGRLNESLAQLEHQVEFLEARFDTIHVQQQQQAQQAQAQAQQ
eukprot:m51a1_g1778 hypothetical protein (88) ;mRNA; f:337934-338300